MLKNSSAPGSFSFSDCNVSEMRDHFDAYDYVHIPQILGTERTIKVQEMVAHSAFVERVHHHIGDNKELCLSTPSTIAMLHLWVNHQALFRFVQDITGCLPISGFFGRVYRFMPNTDHRDAWHSDLGNTRMVAMSINLSTANYVGGVLQLRERDYKESISQELPGSSAHVPAIVDARKMGLDRPMREVVNTGRGDAILFRIDPKLEHRVTPVIGEAAKTAFAGWFQQEPGFQNYIQRKVAVGRGD
jgi:hypothetical protein